MTLALSLFVLFYILMLAVQQYRPWVALGGAGAFLLLGKLGVYDFTLADAARAVDFNVLLMMAGMMGTEVVGIYNPLGTGKIDTIQEFKDEYVIQTFLAFSIW